MRKTLLQQLASGPLPPEAQSALLDLDPTLARSMPGSATLTAETLAAIWPKLNQTEAIKTLRHLRWVTSAHVDVVLAAGETREKVLHALLDLNGALTKNQWCALSGSELPPGVANRVLGNPQAPRDAHIEAARKAHFSDTLSWYMRQTTPCESDAVQAVIDQIQRTDTGRIPRAVLTDLARALNGHPDAAAHAAGHPCTAAAAAMTLYHPDVHDRLCLDDADQLTLTAIIEDPTAPTALRTDAYARLIATGDDTNVAPLSLQPSTGGVGLDQVADTATLDSLLWRPRAVVTEKHELVIFELTTNPNLGERHLRHIAELLARWERDCCWSSWAEASRRVLDRLPNGHRHRSSLEQRLDIGAPRPHWYRDINETWPADQPATYYKVATHISSLTSDKVGVRQLARERICKAAETDGLTGQGWVALARLLEACSSWHISDAVALAVKAAEAQLDSPDLDALAALAGDGSDLPAGDLVDLVTQLR